MLENTEVAIKQDNLENTEVAIKQDNLENTEGAIKQDNLEKLVIKCTQEKNKTKAQPNMC